ncbi:hypothetical protein Cch01nite_16130 [Cellulomonas chitinilytica]|uniref:Lipoprotein n=2 Tax=Cellulomonas chitinilytica TaxID=398759 RepID=A0A919U289_9CELL|nr:hypothetical protein Cch01nite_16130 [Cellulomonas chitinilytica]
MTRARGTVASALAVAVALTLGACADRSRDGFAIVNKSDTAVTVTFVDGLTEVTVEPGHREVVRMPECLGTAVHVTAEGHPDVDIDGSACVGSILYIEKDHSAGIESMYA